MVTHVALALQAKLARTTCTSTKDKRRNAVNSYLNRVDQIQTRFAPSFAFANQAYRDFARGKGGKQQLQKLRGAEVAIIGAREALHELSLQGKIQAEHQRLQNLLG